MLFNLASELEKTEENIFKRTYNVRLMDVSCYNMV